MEKRIYLAYASRSQSIIERKSRQDLKQVFEAETMKEYYFLTHSQTHN